MTGALRAIIIAIGAIIVLIASQVNLLWSLLLLLGAAGTSVWYLWRLRDSEKHESLYGEAPTIRPIRGRQSPQRYDFRASNLDAPFFDIESTNYGKKTPRRRVRGIPIDRFLEFQEKIDSLSQQLTTLLDRLASQTNESTSAFTASSTFTATSATTATANAQARPAKAKKKSNIFNRDESQPSRQPTARFTPQEDKRVFTRFKKSRAGDPWDSSSHWGWRN